MRTYRTLWIALIVLGLGLVAWPQTTHAQSSVFIPQITNGGAPLCRFGVNGSPHGYPIGPLRLGWYIDYQASLNPPALPGLSYTPMLRLEQVGNGYNYSIFANYATTTLAQLHAVIDAHPGAYWFIGNEPDRIQFQDDMEPRAYALAYRDLYQIIKARDPNAQIVAGSIVQPTPVRLEYLDLVLQRYQELTGGPMPVDVWAFHNFILNEASCSHYTQIFPNDPNRVLQECWGADIPPGVNKTDGLRIGVEQNANAAIFKQQVVAFRQWLADRGYRNTPVFLSEFGVLMPKGLFFEEGKPPGPDTDYFSEARVNAFMTETMNYLLTARDPNIGFPGDDNRLVQRFSWYSVDDNIDHNGFLFDRALPRAQSRTVMGDNLARITAGVNADTDFYPTALRHVGATPLASQGPVTLTLEATIANSGNSALDQTAAVRFYDGNPSQGGVQIGDDQLIALQGCGEQAKVQVEWPNVTPGDYQVFVEVVAGVSETNLANNRLSTEIIFAEGQMFLPSTQRNLTLR